LASSEDKPPKSPEDYQRIELKRGDLERMNIPPEFWRAKATDLPNEDLRLMVARCCVSIKKVVENGRGLLLYGPPGAGKTRVATLIAKAARSWKFTVFYSMIWELRECVRSRIPFDDDTTIMDRCREVDVLVLDGLAEEDMDEKLVNLRSVEQLIVYRGQRRRITILTTRFTFDELRKTPRLKAFVRGTDPYLHHLKVEGGTRRRSKPNDILKNILLGEGEEE
jgi:DNA replication protein DnaC